MRQVREGEAVGVLDRKQAPVRERKRPEFDPCGRCKGCGAPLVSDEPGLGLCYSCLWHILGPGYELEGER